MRKINQRLNVLFGLYLNDTATEDEKEELWDYVNDPVYSSDLEQLIIKSYEQGYVEEGLTTTQKDLLLQNIFTSETIHYKVKTLNFWRHISVAAAILLVIGGGLFLVQKLTYNKEILVVKNDINPGKTAATLTLGDGRRIRLSDGVTGKLAQQDGVIITKSVNGKLVYQIKNKSADDNKTNTLTTAKGETYQVRLPDGSLVWLNAASSLTYIPALTKDGLRKVKLEGEGYFEVAKDKKHPFIVQTNKQEVEVLGTHFNVNAYNDEENVKTTLLEGSVKVSALVSKAKTTLKPGQQSVLNQGDLTTDQANIDEALAWKNGEFRFNDKSIAEIMKQIARWYNVTVVFNDQAPNGYLSGSISRNRNLSQVLKMMEKTKEVKFRIEGHTIYVNKYN